MLDTGAVGGLHAPVFDEVLEHNGEGELVRTQDEGTPFDRVSQQERVTDTQDASMEGIGVNVLTTIELEELLAKITEEKKQVVPTVNE